MLTNIVRCFAPSRREPESLGLTLETEIPKPMPAPVAPVLTVQAPPTLLRTMELLAANPQLSPQQLSLEFGVSRDYAALLLKRAEKSLPPRERPQPALTVVAPVATIPAAAAPVVPNPEVQELHNSVNELRKSLEAAQVQIQQLAMAAPVLPTTRTFTTGSRASIQRLMLKGRSAGEIASELGIPTGEVEFTMKVDRLIREHH